MWRYDNMTSPSLPILNVNGDVIGTDGRHLVKVCTSALVRTRDVALNHIRARSQARRHAGTHAGMHARTHTLTH